MQLSAGRLFSRISFYTMWLSYIINAAHDLDDCLSLEKKAAFQLTNLGRRRSTFL